MNQPRWVAWVREDSTEKLVSTRIHYVNRSGETACGKSDFRGEVTAEVDAPPGTPRCRACEARWYKW